MKKTKNLFLLVLAIMFFANLTVISGKAQGPLDGEIVDGSLLTSDESAFDEKPLILQNSLEGDIIPFGTYLSNGISGITDKGGGVVYVMEYQVEKRYRNTVFRCTRGFEHEVVGSVMAKYQARHTPVVCLF